VVHNWSWEPARVEAPAALSDVLNGGSVPTGTALDLGAWDVRVFISLTSGRDSPQT
jgi:beta-galactosidase